MIATLSRREVEQLRKGLEQRPAKLMAELLSALQRIGLRIVATLRRESFRGAPESLSVRSGALRRGFMSEVTQPSPTTGRLVIRNDTPYARIHEYGGVITPRTARALAIPLSAAKTAAGVSRYPGGPRSVPELVYIKRAGRNPILAQRRSGGRLTPLFVLVQSVRIRPRLGFGRTFQRMTAMHGSPWEAELRQAIRRTWRG